MNIRDTAFAFAFAVSLLFSSTSFGAEEFNTLSPPAVPVETLQTIMGCSEDGYAFQDAFWSMLNSDIPVPGMGLIHPNCMWLKGGFHPDVPEVMQNYRFVDSGFDYEFDNVIMYEYVGEGPKFRFIAWNGVWRDVDPDMDMNEAIDALPAEDNAHLLRIEHTIPVTEPGRMLAGCETLNMLSFLISDYLNGYDFDFEDLVCMDGGGRPIPEQYLVNLNTPVTLTTHVGDKAITAYEVEYRGKTAYVLVERDLES